MKVTEKISKEAGQSALNMALVAGLGVTLMVLALAIGAIQGSAADNTVIGLLFAAGLALFILGLVGWFGVAQPTRHFDDINVPVDDDHHGHEEHHGEGAAHEGEAAHAGHH